MNETMAGPTTTLLFGWESQPPDQPESLQLGQSSCDGRTAHLPKEAQVVVGKFEPTGLPCQENPYEITSVVPDFSGILLGEGMEVPLHCLHLRPWRKSLESLQGNIERI